MSICPQPDCGNKVHPDYDTCYRHAKLGVGVTFRGGAIVGRRGWNTTQREFLKEHTGAESGKELARTRPDVERAPS